MESLIAILAAAEELDEPVIIQFAQCHEHLIPLSVIGPVMIEHAKKATVPVCVHLDHGETFEYLETALKIGIWYGRGLKEIRSEYFFVQSWNGG